MLTDVEGKSFRMRYRAWMCAKSLWTNVLSISRKDAALLGTPAPRRETTAAMDRDLSYHPLDSTYRERRDVQSNNLENDQSFL